MNDVNSPKLRFFKLKPKKWFKENAFQDEQGDWFESESARNSWTSNPSDMIYIFSSDINLDWVYILDERDYDDYYIDWAVEYELTKDTYPEYFL